MGRPPFTLQPVFDTVAHHAVRLCAADAGLIHLLDGDVYRPVVAIGGSTEYRRYVAEHPMPHGPTRWSAGSGSSAARSRSRTCRGSRVRAHGFRELGGFRTILGVPMLVERRGRRGARRLAHRGRPVRRAGDELVTTFAAQAAIAIRDVQLVRALSRAARGSPEGRRARGAARDRPGGQLEPRRRRGADDDRHARRRSSPAPTAARSWSSTGHAASSWSARARHEPELARGAAQRHGSTSTRRSSVAPPASGSRSGAPDLARRAARPAHRAARARPAGARWSPCRCCARRRSSARSSCAAGSPVPSRRRPSSCWRRSPSQSALAIAQRAAVPRARGAARRARGRQPAQVGVPGEHVARAAHAAERGHRVLRGAAGADVRRDQRAPGGVPPRHPRLGPAPARAAQRDPRPVEGRGRAGWSWSCATFALPALLEHGAVDGARAGRRARHRAASSTSTGRRRGLRRRAPAQAGPAQPAHQRGQVHRPTAGSVDACRAAPDGEVARSRCPTPASASPRPTGSAIFESFQQGGRGARARRAPASA